MLAKEVAADIVSQSGRADIEQSADNADKNKNFEIPLFFENKVLVHKKAEDYGNGERYAFEQRVIN